MAFIALAGLALGADRGRAVAPDRLDELEQRVPQRLLGGRRLGKADKGIFPIGGEPVRLFGGDSVETGASRGIDIRGRVGERLFRGTGAARAA